MGSLKDSRIVAVNGPLVTVEIVKDQEVMMNEVAYVLSGASSQVRGYPDSGKACGHAGLREHHRLEGGR